jgi:DNA-binding XRE family transcriptional regulator
MLTLTSSHCYHKYGLYILISMSRPSQEPKNLSIFGKRIAALRQERGLTQEQLASKTGLSVDTIGAIEQGRRWARITTLHALSEGLNTTTDVLFKGLK